MNYVYSKANHLNLLKTIGADSVVSFQTFVEATLPDVLVVRDSKCDDELKFKLLTALPESEGYLIQAEKTLYLKFIYSVYLHLVTSEHYRPVLYFAVDLNDDQFKQLFNLFYSNPYIKKLLDLRQSNMHDYKFVSINKTCIAFNFANVVLYKLTKNKISTVPLNIVSTLTSIRKNRLKRPYLMSKQRFNAPDLYAPFLSL